MTPPLLPLRTHPHQGRRTLLISPYPPSRTGLAEYAAVFAAQCAARGFSVRVLTERTGSSEPTPTPPPNVEVEPIWTRDLWGMLRMYIAARNDPAEVVHVSYSFTMFGGPIAGLSALMALGRLSRDRPLVVTLHDVLGKRDLTSETLRLYRVRATPWTARFAVQWILRFFSKRADRIVVHGAEAAAILQRDWGVPASRIVITEFPGYPTTVPASPPAPAPGGVPTVLYYGFLAPYKGVETLLAAYCRARAVAPNRPFRLVIAGTNHPRLASDYAATLRDEAARMGAGEVEFPGYLDDRTSAGLFGSASLVVLPYLKTAGSSGTLASAMGAERPVVVTDLPNLVGQLNGYAKSRVVRPGDVAELAEVLHAVAEGRFVARPPKALAPSSVRHWADLVDRTADVYTSALAARHGTFAPMAAEGETTA